MSTEAPGSTPDSRAAALAMFAGNVPCAFQLNMPSCVQPARWLAWFTHEENNVTCAYNEPMLLCEAHKSLMQTATAPFWRTWSNAKPIPCAGCGTPLRLDRFEPV